MNSRGRGQGYVRMNSRGTRRFGSSRGAGHASAVSVSTDGRSFFFGSHWDMPHEKDILHNYKKSLIYIDGYSENEDKDFSYDNSLLKFFNMKYYPDRYSKVKNVEFDLRVAEEKTKEYTGSPMQGLNIFLHWLISNEEHLESSFDNEKPTCGGDFIFQKNAITPLFQLAYTNQPVAFYALNFRGKTYLVKDKGPQNSYVDTQTSKWCHKFEQYLTTGEDVNEPVSENSDYRCVIKSTLGPHKLLISTSIDFLNPDRYDGNMKDMSPCIYVKCVFDNIENRHKNNFERFKILFFATELALTGASETVIGFRSKEGFVKELRLYSEDDFVSKGKEYWKLETSFTFVANLLTLVHEKAASKPGTVFKFNKVLSERRFEIEESDFKVLPEWYLYQLNELKG